MSEVNERTQRTSLLRGPVTDIPGLTTYLAGLGYATTAYVDDEIGVALGIVASQYFPLAGGTLAGDLDMDAHDIIGAQTINAGSFLKGGLQLATEAFASNASNLASGTVPIARIPTGTTGSTVALGNHSHGNITSAGAIGPTSGLPVLTGASGVLTTGTTTGSGTVVVLATSPTLVTPNIGAATGTSIVLSGNATASGAVNGQSGNFTTGANVGSGGNGLQLGSNARIYSAVINTIKLWNSSINDSPRLNFGGDTSAFPALDRSGTTLRVRLADGSTDGDLSASNITASGSVRPGQFTAATLPSAAANTGRTVQVTDSSVDFPGNIGNTVAGGGANNVDVKSNGTNWRITG